VGVIQEPLERDLSALNRRLDEAVLSATDARADIREQFRLSIADMLNRTEERMIAVVKQQEQINSAYGSALGDLASRLNRLEQDRARTFEQYSARIQRMEDHITSVDERLNDVEENFTHVLRGSALQPDRMGGSVP
jgi:chromosome segregation ATPase